MCVEDCARSVQCFTDRLLTFKQWPGIQTPSSLAMAGFYYLNRDDAVRCFYCRIEISNWKPSDTALSEHLRWSKQCAYANLLCHSSTPGQQLVFNDCDLELPQQSASNFEAAKMLPFKFVLALTALYDGFLYVVRPPACTSASITYDCNTNHTFQKMGAYDCNTNHTFQKMDAADLGGIKVFKVSVQNYTELNTLRFKIKFTFPGHSVNTTWQEILQTSGKLKVTNKTAPKQSSCCITAIVFGVTLLLIVLILIAFYFIFSTVNSAIEPAHI